MFSMETGQTDAAIFATVTNINIGEPVDHGTFPPHSSSFCSTFSLGNIWSEEIDI